MESCWSFQIFNGAEIALFASAKTNGVLIPAAANKISCININPCEEVAVNTLTPAPLAPTAALIALCSDSTLTYLASIFSSATYCAKYSEIVVCGVIG